MIAARRSVHTSNQTVVSGGRMRSSVMALLANRILPGGMLFPLVEKLVTLRQPPDRVKSNTSCSGPYVQLMSLSGVCIFRRS